MIAETVASGSSVIFIITASFFTLGSIEIPFFTAQDYPISIILVAIALVAVVGGFILISNYVMPNIYQICQNKIGTLHCHAVQYHKIF